MGSMASQSKLQKKFVLYFYYERMYMTMYGNQKGLVYTNEKCIGCNKCISACPVITANRAVKISALEAIKNE